MRLLVDDDRERRKKKKEKKMELPNTCHDFRSFFDRASISFVDEQIKEKNLIRRNLIRKEVAKFVKS